VALDRAAEEVGLSETVHDFLSLLDPPTHARLSSHAWM